VTLIDLRVDGFHLRSRPGSRTGPLSHSLGTTSTPTEETEMNAFRRTAAAAAIITTTTVVTTPAFAEHDTEECQRGHFTSWVNRYDAIGGRTEAQYVQAHQGGDRRTATVV
jgi:hypothetical protein